MAVKRVVVEFDDSPDPERGTSLPPAFGAEASPETTDLHATDLPERQPDYGGALEGDAPRRPATSETVGRTFPDLVHDFAFRPECPAVALFTLAVAIFSPQIHKPSDLVLPGIVGVALNILWFGIAGCARLRRHRSRRSPTQ